MNKHKAVRNKIIDACPDIMELKFGCRVNYGGLGDKIMLSNEKHAGKEIVGSGWIISDIQTYKRKILGRTITLCDVLRAWTDGYNINAGSGEICKRWNTSHNSLQWHADNKPEVIDFLYEVLCK